MANYGVSGLMMLLGVPQINILVYDDLDEVLLY